MIDMARNQTTIKKIQTKHQLKQKQTRILNKNKRNEKATKVINKES